MLSLMMMVDGERFTKVPLNFVGKNGGERQRYLQSIAAMLEEEYKEEIGDKWVQYYYEAFSKMDTMEFSDQEMKMFEMKVQSHKWRRLNNHT